MARFALPVLLLLAALVGLLPLGGDLLSPAAADEATCLARLTSAELEALQRRVPGWDELEAAKKERIACAVLRMRNLSEEDRRRLRERGDMYRSRPDAMRSDGRRRRGNDSHAAAMAMAQGALRVALADMPKETVRGFRTARIQRARMEAAFLRRMVESEVARLAPRVHELEDDAFPRWMRRRVADMKTRLASQDDPAMRKRLAMAVLMGRVARLVSEAPEKPKAAEGLSDEERKAFHKTRVAWYEALGAKVEETWPEAFADAKRDFMARASDMDAMKAWLERYGVSPHEARSGIHRLMLLNRLESWARKLAQRDEGKALAHVHGLMTACLRELGRSESEISAFLAKTGAERGAMLQALKSELSEAAGGMGKPGGPGRRDRGPRRGPRGPGRDGGERERDR